MKYTYHWDGYLLFLYKEFNLGWTFDTIEHDYDFQIWYFDLIIINTMTCVLHRAECQVCLWTFRSCWNSVLIFAKIYLATFLCNPSCNPVFLNDSVSFSWCFNSKWLYFFFLFQLNVVYQSNKFFKSKLKENISEIVPPDTLDNQSCCWIIGEVIFNDKIMCGCKRSHWNIFHPVFHLLTL